MTTIQQPKSSLDLNRTRDRSPVRKSLISTPAIRPLITPPVCTRTLAYEPKNDQETQLVKAINQLFSIYNQGVASFQGRRVPVSFELRSDLVNRSSKCRTFTFSLVPLKINPLTDDLWPAGFSPKVGVNMVLRVTKLSQLEAELAALRGSSVATQVLQQLQTNLHSRYNNLRAYLELVFRCGKKLQTAFGQNYLLLANKPLHLCSCVGPTPAVSGISGARIEQLPTDNADSLSIDPCFDRTTNLTEFTKLLEACQLSPCTKHPHLGQPLGHRPL